MPPAPTPSAAEPAAEPRAQRVIRVPFFESDEAVVRALRAGQGAGGAALYDRHHAHVRRVLARVLGPDAEIGDLAQEVFAAAIDAIDDLEDASALRAWLGGIAVHLARAEIRRRARARWFPLFAPERLPDVPAAAAGPEVGAALRATYRVLDRLPADERVAFCLRFVDGMELEEVARACRVSLGTVKRRLARAQKRFVAGARARPELREWLEGGERWS